MTTEELQELLTLLINRNSSILQASSIDAPGAKSVIGVEHEPTGKLFFVEITEA